MKTSAPKRPPLSSIGNDGRPEIVVDFDERLCADKALSAIANEPSLYQQSGSLAHVVTEEIKIQGVTHYAVAPRVVRLPPPRLREMITEHVCLVRAKKKDGGPTEFSKIHPPRWLIEAILARGQYAHVRPLTAVRETPFFRADGTIVDVAGYDAATRTLYEPTAEYLKVADAPTQADAEAACMELVDVVVDFPFAQPMHRAAWLACLLTPFCRLAIDTAPMTIFDANVRGVGKTKLADAVSIIASNRLAARMAQPDDDTEMEKRIIAMARAGTPAVLIDNVSKPLGYSSLDGALTAPFVTGRILGQSEMVKDLPMTMTFMATGNNVTTLGDTARRSSHVRLESPEETPELRAGFKHPDLLAWVRAERPRLVRAALTMVKAYVCAGRPDMRLKPWGSFEQWSALPRAAVVFAGQPDPGDTRLELTERADLESGALRTLIEGFESIDPNGAGLSSSQLIQISANGNDHEGIREAIGELCPTRDGKPPTPKSLGRRLLSLRGRVVGGRCIDSRPSRNGAQLWGTRAVKP